MESSKRKRFSQDKKLDRISSLPNVLLHHILSFVDTLQVVQTCVLSKRWMDVWKSHPYLHFDYGAFTSMRMSDSEVSGVDFITTQAWDPVGDFINSINQVLVRRSNFKVVKLWVGSHAQDLIEPLVYYAVKHQVEEIFIHKMDCYKSVVLPRCFSNCESLRSLSLNADYGHIDLPKSLALPCLKTLYLAMVDFDGKILSSCPNLEYLTIESIELNEIDNFNIHALKLKRLEILRWQDVRIKDGCKVMIFAPKLTHFNFEGCTPLVLSEANLSSIDVNIKFFKGYPSYDFLYGDELEQLSFNLINMLNEFQNAKCLTLSMNIIEVHNIGHCKV